MASRGWTRIMAVGGATNQAIGTLVLPNRRPSPTELNYFSTISGALGLAPSPAMGHASKTRRSKARTSLDAAADVTNQVLHQASTCRTKWRRLCTETFVEGLKLPRKEEESSCQVLCSFSLGLCFRKKKLCFSQSLRS